MKIYCAHSKKIAYKKDLYDPIKESHLVREHEFIFPHETDETHESKEIIRGCDGVIAEVSECATGMGIEMGWANMMDKPIYCFYRSGTKPSGSLSFVCGTMEEYGDEGDLVKKNRTHPFFISVVYK